MEESGKAMDEHRDGLDDDDGTEQGQEDEPKRIDLRGGAAFAVIRTRPWNVHGVHVGLEPEKSHHKDPVDEEEGDGHTVPESEELVFRSLFLFLVLDHRLQINFDQILCEINITTLSDLSSQGFLYTRRPTHGPRNADGWNIDFYGSRLEYWRLKHGLISKIVAPF